MLAVANASSELLSLWPGARSQKLDEITTTDLGVQTKGDGSLVSQADFRSNEIITTALSSLFPGDLLVSEEGVEEAIQTATMGAARSWIIDPLDGTSAFLAGRDDFSVLVGLWSTGVPKLGIMKFPARNLLIVAKSGQGCTVNGEVARVSSHTEPRPERVYMRNFTPKVAALACSNRDSGLAFMQVATGELDAAIIRMTTHKVWDVAAPIVAILEAGGTVTDEHGAPIICGSTPLEARYLVASNTASHQRALTLVD